ncbi:MAG: flagellar export chaperone FliS [Spirochaetota bacterium]
MSKINPLNAYRETKIKTASQSKLVLMLYDEAIKQVGIAYEGLASRSKHLDRVNSAVLKAQDIITELMVSLDFERGGEIAKNLFSLYMFFNQQLMSANMKKDKEPIKKIRDMLVELRNAWNEIINKPGSSGSSQVIGGVNIAG